jgi:hypothetical protein
MWLRSETGEELLGGWNGSGILLWWKSFRVIQKTKEKSRQRAGSRISKPKSCPGYGICIIHQEFKTLPSLILRGKHLFRKRNPTRSLVIKENRLKITRKILKRLDVDWIRQPESVNDSIKHSCWNCKEFQRMRKIIHGWADIGAYDQRDRRII